jgi:hypothetical protein
MKTRGQTEFGCEFCAHPQNRWFGHVPQIAVDDERGLILLRCPRCGTLYENVPVGSDQSRRLTEEQAERLFGPLHS